ncbi:MAG: type II toxin-antitoxin system HicB family antitoxin [Lachnospiraceae bacterium]|nr:type II toxin-antitoxin system HicB family antitoxin [Lachnospiraceae bacterium]
MKKNILEYKGYHTTVEFDAETYMLRGKIEGINDFVNFESDDPRMIEQEFHKAVDDYLLFCQEVGKEPDKEYKGTFNIRIQPALHKKLAFLALKNGESLNTTVEKAIQAYVEGGKVTSTELQQTIRILSVALATQRIYNKEFSMQIAPESKIIPFEGYTTSNIKMSYQESRSN